MLTTTQSACCRASRTLTCNSLISCSFALELILISLPTTYSAPPNISRADPALPPAALMSLSSGQCRVAMMSYVDWGTVYVIMPNRSSTPGARNVERRLLMTASPANAKTVVGSAPAADSHPPVWRGERRRRVRGLPLCQSNQHSYGEVSSESRACLFQHPLEICIQN